MKKKNQQQNGGFAFISSPYAAVLSHIQDRQYAMSIIRSFAKFGCKKALDNKFVPFSPILTFGEIFNESQRELIMQHCFEAISKSQVLYVIKTGYFNQSNGMKDEIAYAKSISLPIITIEYKNGGVK